MLLALFLSMFAVSMIMVYLFVMPVAVRGFAVRLRPQVGAAKNQVGANNRDACDE